MEQVKSRTKSIVNNVIIPIIETMWAIGTSIAGTDVLNHNLHLYFGIYSTIWNKK